VRRFQDEKKEFLKQQKNEKGETRVTLRAGVNGSGAGLCGETEKNGVTFPSTIR
jgi:hypothetical protein